MGRFLIIGRLAGKTYLQVLRLAELAAAKADPGGAERRRIVFLARLMPLAEGVAAAFALEALAPSLFAPSAGLLAGIVRCGPGHGVRRRLSQPVARRLLAQPERQVEFRHHPRQRFQADR